MNDKFNEKYFRCNNYATYLERQERYERMVQELHYDLFRKVCFDFKDKNVLDFGCAVGFVVRALNDLDYKWVYGYDVSEWAIQYGLENGIVQSNVRLTSTKSHIIGSPGDDVTPRWDLTLALDVLEHLCQSELDEFIDELNTDYLLVRIPLAVNDGGKFVLTVSENDPTHITRLTRESWMQIFNTRYIHLFNINLGLMYDTSGVMCAMFKQRHDNV